MQWKSLPYQICEALWLISLPGSKIMVLLLSVVVGLPIQLPHCPLTTFRSGQDFKYRTDHIMHHTTFSHLKLSMLLPHQTLGYSATLMLPLLTLIHLKSGQAATSMVLFAYFLLL